MAFDKKIFGLICIIILSSACIEQLSLDNLPLNTSKIPFLVSETTTTSTTQNKATTTSSTTSLRVVLSDSPLNQFYEPQKTSFKSNLPAYSLPLDAASINNFGQISQRISLSPAVENKLLKNGFVVIDYPWDSEDNMGAAYETLKNKNIPLFITSDYVLHLYHIQFMETLRQVEEDRFYDLLYNISLTLYDRNRFLWSDEENLLLKDAYRDNMNFFAVALTLLSPEANQTCVDKQEWVCKLEGEKFTEIEYKKYRFELPSDLSLASEEVSKIKSRQGFSPSPLFKYREDYTQYLPRGHYTRSAKLRNYFKAMMWYGRMGFLLKEDLFRQVPTENPTQDVLRQTMSASEIARQIQDNPHVGRMWDDIYDVTSFFVGYSDDLGPYAYLEAVNEVFGRNFHPRNLLDEDKYFEFKSELSSYGSPKIYGGTGDCIVDPGSKKKLEGCLTSSSGFRFMGQRFVPDSYVFQNLVNSGNVGAYNGSTPYPFTFGVGTRVFPRGLDLMSLLGSSEAMNILKSGQDTNYIKYFDSYHRLRTQLDAFTVSEWNKNLYFSWLYTLKPLLSDYGSQYPEYMETPAFRRKQLNTALASWTQLRHDTILYAKQSYTLRETAIMQQKTSGYVEPVPHFYDRLIALTKMTRMGLSGKNALTKEGEDRLTQFEGILVRLKDISVKELEGSKLSDQDLIFINQFTEDMDMVLAEINDNSKKTTLVADVHTDSNSKLVLEEASGYVDLILVAFRLPGQKTMVGAGPVFTYYEFKQPMDDRLTDEVWRSMLDEDPPQKPSWVDLYAGGS